jgi:hypothetical protein
METSHEPPHSDKRSLVSKRSWTYKFHLNIILFHEALKYANGATFLDYVQTDAEPLCV